MLEYLTTASRSAKAQEQGGAAGGGDGGGGGGGGGEWDAGVEEDMSIEAMLKEASPVLEAFGNAKTSRSHGRIEPLP